MAVVVDVNPLPGPGRQAITNTLLILCVVALFLLMNADLATRGMMPDGTLYASISRDLAQGKGSFWFPPSYVPHAYFYDHPALGMYLESLLFRVLGDHFWVENLYTVLVLAIAVGLIHQIQLSNGDKATWFAVLLFLLCPLASFTYTNNFLENTLVVFNLAALLAALASIDRPPLAGIGLAALSGGCVLAGLLVKGPVALWPLMVYPLHVIVYRSSVPDMLSRLGVQLATVVCAVGLIYFSTGGRHAIDVYLHNQIVASLNGSRHIEWGRSLFAWQLAKNLAGPILLCVVAMAVTRRRSRLDRFALLMLLLALAASLPLLISPRQYPHYILPSLPLYALAFASVCEPFSDSVVTRLQRHPGWLWTVLGGMFVVGVMLFAAKAGTSNQDSRQLKFVNAISAYVGRENVRACRGFNDLRLQMYLYRYLHVKLTNDRVGYMVCDVPVKGQVVTRSTHYSLIRLTH